MLIRKDASAFPTPSFQFLSPNADDAKWLIWGRSLFKRGMRGSTVPAEGVRIDITDHVIRVTGTARGSGYWYGAQISTATSTPPTTTIVHIEPGIPSVTVTSASTVVTSAFDPWFVAPMSRTDFTYSFKDGDGVVVATSTGSIVPERTDILGNGYTTWTDILYSPLDSATWAGIETLRAALIEASLAIDITDRWQFISAYKPFVGAPTSGSIDAASPTYDSLVTAGIAASDIVIQVPGTDAAPNSLLANLKAGILQDEVLSAMRSYHPKSYNAYQESLMTVDIAYGSSGSGDDVTNTMDVTLSYTDAEGLHTETISGSQHIVTTWCADSMGDPDMATYTITTYDNWLPLDLSPPGTTGEVLDYTYLTSDFLGLAQIWDGVRIDGAATYGELFDSYGGLYNPPQLQTSQAITASYPQLYIDYRAATNRLYTTADAAYAPIIIGYFGYGTIEDLLVGEGYADVAEFFAAQGATSYTTLAAVLGIADPRSPQFAAISGLGYTTLAELLVGDGYADVAELFAAYGATTWRELAVAVGADPWGTSVPDWLDPTFQDGEQIDIFPLSVFHSELGDLGVFPDAGDIADETKLTFRATMKATYTYSYNTGQWTGSGADLATSVTIPYQAGVNFIFHSRAATPWEDLLGPDDPIDPGTYLGQATSITASPASYPLFVPLLNS